MAQLSDWLKLMNAEIARKREEAERAREEELRRQTEQAQAPAANDPPRPQSKAESKRESKRA